MLGVGCQAHEVHCCIWYSTPLPGARRPQDGSTPLIIASYFGKLEAVDLLDPLKAVGHRSPSRLKRRGQCEPESPLPVHLTTLLHKPKARARAPHPITRRDQLVPLAYATSEGNRDKKVAARLKAAGTKR